MLKYTDISTNIHQVKVRYKILCYCWRIGVVILSLSISNAVAFPQVDATRILQTDISLVWLDDFRDFPRLWEGNTTNFTVDESVVPFRLHQITDSGSGTNSIFRNSTVFYGKWEFSVHFDGFSTSNQNRVKFWLIKPTFTGPDGIIVRIGENGSTKRIRLLHVDDEGNEQTIIASTSPLPDGVVTIDVNVEHSQIGEWILSYKFNKSDDFQVDSAFYEASLIKKGTFIGLTSEFTRTRVDKFSFGPIRLSKFPLFFERVEITNNENIRLLFSENLPLNFGEGLSISIKNYPGSITTTTQNNAINLQLSTPLDGGNWILNLNGLSEPDLHYELEPLQIQFSVTDRARLFDIVINEFIPKPTTEPGLIELLNTSPKLLNLNNWTLGIGTRENKIYYSNPINPGDLILIGPDQPPNGNASNTHYINLDLVDLPKTQGSIWISSDESVLIDSVRYDREWSDKIADGLSLEKINPSYIGIDKQNWKTHTHSNSFGIENEAINSELFDLKLLSAIIEQDSVFVRFNYHTQNSSDTSIKIRGSEINNYGWNVWTGNKLKFKSENSDWIHQESTFLEIDGISLFGDDTSQTFTIEIAHPPEKDDLTINEILYDPIKDRYSSYNDQSEFIEIKNHRPYKISLKNMIIRDGIDKFGKYRSWMPENSLDWSVPGHDYAVIFADTAFSIENAQLIQFFQVEIDQKWGQVRSSTLGLVTSGREVILSDINGLAFDSVFYSPEMHHPLVRETKGRSLEKIENLSTSTGSKWTTSASIRGGTPGEMNSNTIPIDASNSEKMVQLHPNPFSPDQDGLNDVTIISISLKEPGYLLRMSVFDRFGYKIGDLIRDEIIGTSFSTFWDGTDSSGNLLGTGVYIIWISAIHRENKSELNFKKPVVLVRKK
jgi:hypothetical protein